ncbi:MAG: DNA polymerase III subunit alpha [Firmicutes bacterium]|nr:DNA polymerase III subunit alpha [Bacillota bacterium]
MYNTLGFKSDYSILKSLIKIDDLVSFCVTYKSSFAAIIDDNLFSSIEFYDKCKANNIKPIIGLDILIEDKHFYVFAKDYTGYKSLLKINTLQQKKELTIDTLSKHNDNVIMVVPFNVKDYFNQFRTIFKDIYISYENEYEKKNSNIITKNIVCLNIVNSLKKSDDILAKILDSIRNDNKHISINTITKINEDDYQNNLNFANSINIDIPKGNRYIPIYPNEVNDSYKYLYALCHKGLQKRFNNKVEQVYIDRLNHELDVIKSMGFVDYFLIVYDYVKFAKQNNIMVGPGRGSAAGSLVSYAIGITNVDPIKYDLLFERFLNPERITMPDIDVDFEDAKRDQVIEYVKEKYGKEYVAPIMTFGTLASRQVLKDVAKYFELDNMVDVLTKAIDPKLNLLDNSKDPKVKKILNLYPKLQEVYKQALVLEGLKRQISTTAAGVAISSVKLDDIVPVCINDNNILCGLTLNYLEELGIIKMDFLGLTNLSIIHNILDMTNNEIKLSSIKLDDEEVYKLFGEAKTEGIFQFESEGMKNFLKKLKPKNFSELYAALALFRPGPMEYIDEFIQRKEGKVQIDYIDDSLKDILKETYGIIIYQEQIMQILVKMAKFTFAEADLFRRAMSKKKESIILSEKEHFIKSAISNGYSEAIANKTFERILKFASYGFNKSHSVSYALIGYQMAYLKVHYKEHFIANLLNMSIGNINKTNEYLTLAKKEDIFLLKPSINESNLNYTIEDKKLRLPLSIIKNVGTIAEEEIISKRTEPFKDFFEFVAKCYSKNVNKKVIENLIYASCFDSFNYNHKTLIDNLDNAIRYSELYNNLDSSLIEKPILEESNEFTAQELQEQELEVYGFYLSNHPASKYQGKDITKLDKIDKKFNTFVKSIVIIDNIRAIKTKKGDNMAFIKASDETSKVELVVFASVYNTIKDIKKNDLVEVMGRVTKNISDYQITVNKITKL